jgi:hypothetical protein
MITPPLLRLVFPRRPSGPSGLVVEESVASAPQEAASHR